MLLLKHSKHYHISFSKCMPSMLPDPISTHVLDTTTGLPASGIAIRFEKLNNNTKIWEYVMGKYVKNIKAYL